MKAVREFLTKVVVRVESLLALRITQEEHLRRLQADPYNIFDSADEQKPLRVAVILAIATHILLFLIVFPSFSRNVIYETRNLITLRNLALPDPGGGGGGSPAATPPKPVQVAPEPKPRPVPIPDPTPDAPETMVRLDLEQPEVVDRISTELNIGDVTAPPGNPGLGGEGSGSGTGRGSGVGPGLGGGEGGGPYRPGGGVTEPILIFGPEPPYTEEARKNKIQGVVVLQAIIRRDGSVDNLRVVRSLGFGLEDSAIKTIATQWKFKPGMKGGQPVDVYATIEVYFRLL
ncbi:MAG: TonB family protein [Acidobacteria bacterium]|nr:TonB family protein [Acidobacteriota bacterium]